MGRARVRVAFQLTACDTEAEVHTVIDRRHRRFCPLPVHSTPVAQHLQTRQMPTGMAATCRSDVLDPLRSDRWRRESTATAPKARARDAAGE